MTRRELIAGAAGLFAAAPLAVGKTRITKANISAITDEIGVTQADAIAFAHQYGLQWVELRNVPETKKEFAKLGEPELRQWAAQLVSEKLKVSFLNTSMLKFTWPGMTPARPERGDNPELLKKKWDSRLDDLRNAVMAANILGVDKVRVFTGTRVEHPETTYPLIVRTMEEMIPIAEKAKVHLLIENEYSQNIGTSQESKDILAMLPSKTIGLNWDPQNAQVLKEDPWPTGYALVPKSRMLNAQFKARNVLPASPDILDWQSILAAMQKDGYKGRVGLETHTPGESLIKNAHLAMETVLRMVGKLS